MERKMRLVRWRVWYGVALALALSLSFSLGAVIDGEGDADVPCIDIVKVEVEGNSVRTVVRVFMSPREYPSDLLVNGVEDLNEVRLCRHGLYRVLIDTDASGSADFELFTAIDGDGESQTGGVPSLTARLDVSAGELEWTFDNVDLGLAEVPATVNLTVAATIVPPNPVLLLEEVIYEDALDGAWLAFPIGATAATLIGADGGTLLVDNEESALYGMKLEIPPNALSDTVAIVIEESQEVPPVGASSEDGLLAFRIGPATTVLSYASGLAVPLQRIDGGNDDISHYSVLRFDEEIGLWRSMRDTQYDSESRLIGTSLLFELGDFVVTKNRLYVPRQEFEIDENAEDATKADLDRQCRPERGKPLTVLVHGWQKNALMIPCTVGSEETFGNLATLLEAEGDGAVCAFSYDSGHDIRESANSLRGLLEDVIATYGISEIRLIAHSQGGLVTRTMLEDEYYLHAGSPPTGSVASFVSTLQTAGTPHLGLSSARARLCTSLRQMVPSSDFLECSGGADCETESGDETTGLNFRLRNNPTVFESLVSQKYRILAAWDDRVVEQNSALGETCADLRDRTGISATAYDPTVEEADSVCDVSCAAVGLTSGLVVGLAVGSPAPGVIAGGGAWAVCEIDCLSAIDSMTGSPGDLAHNGGAGQCVVPYRSAGEPSATDTVPVPPGRSRSLFSGAKRHELLPDHQQERVSLVHSNSQSRVKAESADFPSGAEREPTTLGIVFVTNHEHPAWPVFCGTTSSRFCGDHRPVLNENFDYGEVAGLPTGWTLVSGDANEIDVEDTDNDPAWGPYFLEADEEAVFEMTRLMELERAAVEGRRVVLQATMFRGARTENYRLDWAGLVLGFGKSGRICLPNALSGKTMREKFPNSIVDKDWRTLYVFADFGNNTADLYMDGEALALNERVEFDSARVSRVRLQHGSDWVNGSFGVDDIRVTILDPPQSGGASLTELLESATFAAELRLPGGVAFNVDEIAQHPNYSEAYRDGEHLILSGGQFADLQASPEPGLAPPTIPQGIGLTYVFGPENTIWVLTDAELPNALITVFGFDSLVAKRPQNLYYPSVLRLSRAEIETSWAAGHEFQVNWHPKFLTLPQIAMHRLKLLQEDGLLRVPISDREIFDRPFVRTLNNLERPVVIGLAKHNSDCLRAGPHSNELLERWWPKGSADPCGTTEYGFTLNVAGLGEHWYAHGLAYGDGGTRQIVRWDGSIYVEHSNYGARERYDFSPERLPLQVSTRHENVWSGNHNAFTVVAVADWIEFLNVWEIPSVGPTPEPIVVRLDPGWSEFED